MFSDRTNWRLAHNRFTQAVEEVRASGGRLLDLSASNPTRVGLDFNPQAIRQSLASPQRLDYDPQAKGLPSSRGGVATYYRTAPGIHSLHPEPSILTSSTSERHASMFRPLCYAGDEV